MRGNPEEVGCYPIYDRSIPACAGEPYTEKMYPGFKRVYPRVCGGTTGRGPEVDRDSGLSPRVRGNLVSFRSVRSLRGSIPACAGEPVFGMLPYAAIKVYPRVCGGTNPYICCACISSGLSPRVRGNPNLQAAGNAALRSIPACAGEPNIICISYIVSEVYPRVCGGTALPSLRPCRGRGLSPRVRGNLFPFTDYDSGWRSIPACAGEPRPCAGEAR